MFPASIYVDSGYYDILMQIGYAGSAVIIVFVGWVPVSPRKFILKTSRELKYRLGAGEKAMRSFVRSNAAVEFLGSHRRTRSPQYGG